MAIHIEPASVVVAVDGSPASDAAIGWAVDYAQQRNLPLAVVHSAGSIGSSQIPFPADAEEMLMRAAQPVTDHALSLVRSQAPDLDVTAVTPLEDPRETILEASEQALMVVLGRRGRGPVASLLMGSVSSAVASHAHCPVTVVRPPGDEAERDEGYMVVGVSLEESSQAALDVAFEMASQTGRTLDAVHAWALHDTFLDTLDNGQRLAVIGEHERGFAEALAGHRERFPDVTVTQQMPDGVPVDVLVALSARAAHLVVGHRDRHRVPVSLGSVSRAVVERARCPVTLARPVHGPR